MAHHSIKNRHNINLNVTKTLFEQPIVQQVCAYLGVIREKAESKMRYLEKQNVSLVMSFCSGTASEKPNQSWGHISRDAPPPGSFEFLVILLHQCVAFPPIIHIGNVLIYVKDEAKLSCQLTTENNVHLLTRLPPYSPPIIYCIYWTLSLSSLLHWLLSILSFCYGLSG